MRPLKPIKAEDLVLSQNDTKYILTVFSPSMANRINNSYMNDNLRALAQGLLIEGVQASKNVNATKEVAEFLLVRNPLKPIKFLKVLKEAATIIYNYNKDSDSSLEVLKSAGFSKEVMNIMRAKWSTEIGLVLDGVGLNYVAKNDLNQKAGAPHLNFEHAQTTKFGANLINSHTAQSIEKNTMHASLSPSEMTRELIAKIQAGEANTQQSTKDMPQTADLNSDYYTKRNKFGFTQAMLDEANQMPQSQMNGHSV